jgi:hypothetical protein
MSPGLVCPVYFFSMNVCLQSSVRSLVICGHGLCIMRKEHGEVQALNRRLTSENADCSHSLSSRNSGPV